MGARSDDGGAADRSGENGAGGPDVPVFADAAFQWRASWWQGAMLAAAGASLLLLALFASKFIVGYPISIALAIAAWQAQTTAK